MSKQYNPIEYPNSGVQHARVIIALTISQACLDVFKPGDADAKGQVDAIQKGIFVCSKQTTKKKMSVGTKRALDSASHAIAPYLEKVLNDPANSLERWAALVWCGLTFIEDVCATCPQYRKAEWQKLRTDMAVLADALRDLAAYTDEKEDLTRVDIEGTAIYEETAWALECADYVSPIWDMHLLPFGLYRENAA